MSYTSKTKLMRVLIYILLVVITLICIVPLYILIINATRSTPEIQQGLSILPGKNTIINWDNLANRGLNLLQGFWNSLFIAVSTTVLTVYFSMMAAYGLEVYNFKLKRSMYNFILILVLIPLQASIIGYFQYMSALKLTNSYIPLILPSIAAPASIFFAKQYLESVVVKDLIYAARIDGCGEFSIFNRIMLPIAAPGAFTLGIFSFVGSWNSLFTPFIMISKTKLYTLPMMVSTLRGDTYRTEYGSIYLGLAVSIVPIIIVYAIFSKYIINGMAMGALKE